jgi:hypothetical protein
MKSNELYRELDLSVFYINDIAIPFDTSWNNIGINLSGGADSALLAFLLCDHIKKNNINCKIHVITYHRCWKTRPWQIKVSIDVYEKIKELFPTLKFERHQGYIPPELEWGSIGPIFKDPLGKTRSGDQLVVNSYNEYLIYQKKLNAIFDATSCNPDVSFDGKIPSRDKNLEEIVLEDLVLSKNGIYGISPFRFVRKDWILFQYQSFSLLDLYHTTRSCEGEFENITFENYQAGQYVPVCGKCFWCKEREWAERKNGL